MASKNASLDALIARLRERAADPERRVESRPGASMDELRGLAASFDLGQLGRALTALRGGQIDQSVLAKAESFVTKMTERKMPALPPPASAAELDAAEADLGAALPIALRRVYLEVANGGFGPAGGLLPLEGVASTYRELRSSSPGPEGCDWPEKVVPVIDQSGGYTCVDAATGKVVDFDPELLLEEWDPDDPDEKAAERGWKRCFREIAPSVESWLAQWVDSPTLDERIAKQMSPASIEQARRAAIASLTPEQRKAMGLTDDLV